MSKQENLDQLEKHWKKIWEIDNGARISTEAEMKRKYRKWSDCFNYYFDNECQDVTFSLAYYTHTNYFQIWDEPVKFLISCKYLKTSRVGF